ncbi:MAG: hypothetical protein PHW18_01975 [Sulfuricurvum sp.]|uniref:hypothetical protein n=1 Tax=Sulfuricurvum sp. TaxID=2025608 RepID=UPI002617DF3B|nr:hypothetical protein [Sulfuricurvum sp.]MDD2828323.1 hypothetical protein [Sulfuricurvum sp.]MDD4949722.1 hypothetical protein [Sulfuricurvum sp.]
MKTKSPLFVMVVLVIVSMAAALWEYTNVSELREQQDALRAEVKEIESLKTRWSTQTSQSDFEYFKNHPNLTKQEKRGGNIYLEYNNLSSSEFNLLSNKLLNSMLVIKKMTLRHNGSSKGSIIVEIES